MSVHGKNTRIYAGEYDISSTLKKAEPTATIDKHDTTCFGANSKSYDVGLKDGSLSLSGLFTGNAGETDRILQAALGDGSGTIISQAIDTDTVGKPARLLLGREASYKCAQVVSDLVTVDGDIQASGGIQFGVFLHANAAETANGSGTAVNNGASTANGWTAHLHVFAFDGTNITFTLKDSADNVTYAALTGGAFTQVTGTTKERLQSADGAAVNQYTKIYWSGTFTSCTFAVTFSRQK